MMKTLVLIVLFLLVGAFFIISTENIHLTDSNDAARLYSSYLNWGGKLVGNSRTMTGYVVGMNWLP